MSETFTMGATTRYYGPTNTRPARIAVELANGARVTVSEGVSA